MKTYKLLIYTLLGCSILGSSCKGSQKDKETPIITVSILPIKYLVEKIVDQDFDLEVLVPPGASPETYEPTPRQVVRINDSEFIFTTGLMDFERNLIAKFAKTNKLNIIDLSRGINLLEGHCHHHGREKHTHGSDPHIWTSPKQLLKMSETIFKTLKRVYPDSIRYVYNYENLRRELIDLERETINSINNSKIKSFFIYHPAFTYYANDYGVEQVSIEENGKEPSAERMQKLITRAKKDKITKIFYQKEFSRRVVETVARDMNVSIVEIDPLAEDIPEVIRDFTTQITSTE